MRDILLKMLSAIVFISLVAFGLARGTNASMLKSDREDVDYQKVHLLAPLAGERLLAGTKQKISWSSSSEIEYVTIEYSVNGGKDWLGIVKSRKIDAPFDYYLWQVPCTLSDKVKVRISDSYGPFYDLNLGDFSIVDETPPSIQLSLQKTDIWPADGKMVDVGFSLSITDNCDPSPHISLKVTSDEPPQRSPGGEAVGSEPDVEILPDKRILLRAQRSTEGNGRVYLITVSAIDASNNNASSAVAVRVNPARDKKAVDDGQFYQLTSTIY